MRNLLAVIGLTLSAATSNATTLTTLASFAVTNGQHPGSLFADMAGNFYGTTASGGVANSGTVFKLDTTGLLTTVVSFTGANGSSPSTGLIADKIGNLYGTTYLGGATYDGFPGSGKGTVFKLDKTGTLTTLTSFTGPNGQSPTSLTFDATGNLYGTTQQGGTNYQRFATGDGTVFKLDTDGTLTTLASFAGTNGVGPIGGLAADGAGNFYGTTAGGGGSGDYGTIYKLDPTGVLTTIVSFDRTNGAAPFAGLTADTAGNFFGTTTYGGTNDKGTIFKLDPTGTLTTLASFAGTNGEAPYAGLIIDAAGNLFGTTTFGGLISKDFERGKGTVFKLDATGKLSTLAYFTGPDGQLPDGTLTADAAGNLYGTTSDGGPTRNAGTVFKITDAGFITFGAAVPEPATWALMVIGFGITGATVRRRRTGAVLA